MVQKIIRIGTSAGVTIPKKELENMGLAVGDEVNITIKPVHKSKGDELMRNYDKFVSEYGETLKNLADR